MPGCTRKTLICVPCNLQPQKAPSDLQGTMIRPHDHADKPLATPCTASEASPSSAQHVMFCAQADSRLPTKHVTKSSRYEPKIRRLIKLRTLHLPVSRHACMEAECYSSQFKLRQLSHPLPSASCCSEQNRPCSLYVGPAHMNKRC